MKKYFKILILLILLILVSSKSNCQKLNISTKINKINNESILFLKIKNNSFKTKRILLDEELINHIKTNKDIYYLKGQNDSIIKLFNNKVSSDSNVKNVKHIECDIVDSVSNDDFIRNYSSNNRLKIKPFSSNLIKIKLSNYITEKYFQIVLYEECIDKYSKMLYIKSHNIIYSITINKIIYYNIDSPI